MNASHRRQVLLYALLPVAVAAAIWAQGDDPAMPAAAAPTRTPALAEATAPDRAALEIGRARGSGAAPTSGRDPSPTAAGRAGRLIPEIDPAGFDRPRLKDKAATDLFEARSWAPPPPPPPPPPKAEPPRAPPLPYAFIGRLVEDGRSVVFLSRQDRNFAVREGERLETNYRVDSIGENNMTMTYLPLDQKQTLAFGSAR